MAAWAAAAVAAAALRGAGWGAGWGVGCTPATALISRCCSSAARRASSRMAVRLALMKARSPPHSLQAAAASSLGWKAPQAQNQPCSVSWGTQVSWGLPVRACSVLAMEAGSTRG